MELEVVRTKKLREQMVKNDININEKRKLHKKFGKTSSYGGNRPIGMVNNNRYIHCIVYYSSVI